VRLQEESELPPYGVVQGRLNKHTPAVTLPQQVLAYKADLKSGYSFCSTCRGQSVELPRLQTNAGGSEGRVHGSYGFVRSRPTRCSRHRLPDVECVKDLCSRGGVRPLCFECVGARVRKFYSVSLCETYGSLRYQGHCARCFAYLYPDQPVARRFRTKEWAVLDYVTELWPELPWVTNKTTRKGVPGVVPTLWWTEVHLGAPPKSTRTNTAGTTAAAREPTSRGALLRWWERPSGSRAVQPQQLHYPRASPLASPERWLYLANAGPSGVTACSRYCLTHKVL
jgi:hypothetical protein